jgi:hypothetical protein
MSELFNVGDCVYTGDIGTGVVTQTDGTMVFRGTRYPIVALFDSSGEKMTFTIHGTHDVDFHNPDMQLHHME